MQIKDLWVQRMSGWVGVVHCVLWNLVATHEPQNRKQVFTITVWECPSCCLDMAMNNSQTLSQGCQALLLICGEECELWHREAHFISQPKWLEMTVFNPVFSWWYTQSFQESVIWAAVTGYWSQSTIQCYSTPDMVSYWWTRGTCLLLTPCWISQHTDWETDH